MVVQHELAHQWFGNMVTMTWWDNIWLNESFANLIGYIACEEVQIEHEDVASSKQGDGATNVNFVHKIDGEDVWIAFSHEKQRALVDDCLPSTHPIEAPCKDNEVAQSLLDGITYGKGAVFLHQLIQTLGKKVFFNGCKLYFKKYAWQNTTLSDFIGSLQESLEISKENVGQELNFDLLQFSDIWLKYSGCNQITSKLLVEDDTYYLELSQQEFNKFQTTVGLYRP